MNDEEIVELILEDEIPQAIKRINENKQILKSLWRLEIKALMKDLLLSLENLSGEQLGEVVKRIEQIKIERSSKYSPESVQWLINQTTKGMYVRLKYGRNPFNPIRTISRVELMNNIHVFLPWILDSSLVTDKHGRVYLQLEMKPKN